MRDRPPIRYTVEVAYQDDFEDEVSTLDNYLGDDHGITTIAIYKRIAESIEKPIFSQSAVPLWHSEDTDVRTTECTDVSEEFIEFIARDVEEDWDSGEEREDVYGEICDEEKYICTCLCQHYNDLQLDIHDHFINWCVEEYHETDE